MFAEIPLILFAKAPVAGKVKTRLTPPLTPENAVRVAEILLEESIKLAIKAWEGRVVLAIWPDASHPFIQKLLKKYQIELMVQGEGNLGEKMHQAMQAQGYPCVVMGCDVPHCPSKELKLAYQTMAAGQDVIGLTEDGGYYLLGLQKPCSSLFQAIVWGGKTVAEVTLQAAKRESVLFKKLGPLNDIDEYADLIAASMQIPALAQFVKLNSTPE